MSNKLVSATVGAKKTDTEKKKRNKIIAASVIGAAVLAAVVVLVLVLVFDIGPVRPIRSSKDDARVVGTVAGFEVKYEELRYVTLANRAELDEKYGKYDTLSDADRAKYDSELETAVTEDIKRNYVILALCENYGVDIDSKDAKNYVNDEIKSLVDEIGGKKEYKKWLSDNGLTDALLRLTYKVSFLESALTEKLAEDGKEIVYTTKNLAEFVDFVMEDESYVKVIHAYYPREWQYVSGYDANARAEEAHDKLSGEANDQKRFSVMKSVIGGAPFVQGYSVTGSDYYITYGQMHEKYEDAAFSLDEYGVSDIVELEEGYYIIMRVPKDRDEVGLRANEFLKYYQYAVVKRLSDEKMKTVSFSGNDYFASIDLSDIK